MPNTYTQVYVHVVFAVKFREALIDPYWKERLHQYITGIIQANKHKMVQINSMPDHIHILFGLNTDQSIASLVQNVKAESTKWINRQRLTHRPFNWQSGYGAFTLSRSSLSTVAQYIQNQEVHHKKESFEKEFKRQLTENSIEFDEKYTFKTPA
jgi:putative transposase